MMDIVSLNQGEDMKLADAIVCKAGNVLSIQIGSLEYAQEFGVDLKFFLTSDFQIQTQSFQAYMVQRLTESQINVAEVLTLVNTFTQQYTYYVGDVAPQNGGLIL